MHAPRQPRRTLEALVISTVAVLAGVGLVLASVPGSEPVILVIGVVAGMALYGALYTVQRRRHW